MFLFARGYYTYLLFFGEWEVAADLPADLVALLVALRPKLISAFIFFWGIERFGLGPGLLLLIGLISLPPILEISGSSSSF